MPEQEPRDFDCESSIPQLSEAEVLLRTARHSVDLVWPGGRENWLPGNITIYEGGEGFHLQNKTS